MNRQDSQVDLQQMRYVVAVAEERSFTRAAERCFVVQSALSHQIKTLERELGVTLFARSSRRVELTAAGEAFLASARVSLEAAERAATEASAAAGEVRGTLSIGVIPTVTAIDVPEALAAFHAAHPQVRVRLCGGGSEEFVEQIAAGRLDAAFIGLAESTPPQQVASRELAAETLVAVLPPGHRVAGRRRVSLRDLAEDAFVDFPAGSAGRAQSDVAFERAQVSRDVAFEATSTDLMLGLVRHGLAVALLSLRVVPSDLALVTVPIVDGPRRVEYLAWSTFNPSPAARAFVDIVKPLVQNSPVGRRLHHPSREDLSMNVSTKFGATSAAGLLAAAALTGCSSSTKSADSSSSAGSKKTLTVYAAASLKKPFTELGKQFEKAHPGVTVKFNFAGSSDLASQLKEGAPADVVAMADERNMKKVTDDSLLADKPAVFTKNKLTIVVPKGNPKHVAAFKDLGKSGTKVVVCAHEVPCGGATEKVEQKTGVTIKPVSEESKVTDVLAKVTSADADAGVVYVSDAKTADAGKVQQIAIPDAINTINSYPIGVVKNAKQADLAKQFVALVEGSNGQSALTRAGFMKTT